MGAVAPSEVAAEAVAVGELCTPRGEAPARAGPDLAS